MAQLEAKNITKAYRIKNQSLLILHGISCSIETGEFVALTGVSGSGKSTLMHILGCLDTPTTGTYLFEEHDTREMTPDELSHIRNQKIGFIFQTFQLIQDLTAQENVALPQLYAGKTELEAYNRATQTLNTVGLSERLHYYPNQLSGGQQQRVAIARALVNDPDVILADEPTGNLDSKTGQMIMDIFLELNREKKRTIILVTHDQMLAKKADRIITLLDGQIISDTKNL